MLFPKLLRPLKKACPMRLAKLSGASSTLDSLYTSCREMLTVA